MEATHIKEEIVEKMQTKYSHVTKNTVPVNDSCGAVFTAFKQGEILYLTLPELSHSKRVFYSSVGKMSSFRTLISAMSQYYFKFRYFMLFRKMTKKSLNQIFCVSFS